MTSFVPAAGAFERRRQASLEIVVPDEIVTEVVDAIGMAIGSDCPTDGHMVLRKVIGVANIRDIG